MEKKNRTIGIVGTGMIACSMAVLSSYSHEVTHRRKDAMEISWTSWIRLWTTSS